MFGGHFLFKGREGGSSLNLKSCDILQLNLLTEADFIFFILFFADYYDITGVYCSCGFMVTVPLDLQGDEAKEGDVENQEAQGDDGFSAVASVDFAASLPSASIAPSVSSNEDTRGKPLILPEVTESSNRETTVQSTLHKDAVGRSDRISQQIFDATLILARNEKLASPIRLWLPKLDLVSDLFRLPVLGRLSHLENAVNDATLNTRPTAEGVYNMPFAKRRLMTSRLAKSDDALLTSALKKLRNLVLFWPEDSRLGRTLLRSAGAVVGEDVLQQSLKDCFAGKAVATLVKRASDYTRFAEFQVSCNNGRPLNPSEGDVYAYLCHLRQQGAGATAGESFISAWKFMQHTVGAGASGTTDIVSGRIRGAAKDLMAKKRKLQQAPPLPAEVVWKLEGLMTERIQPKVKAILGFMLFCLYSCSRFADAARAQSPAISEFQHVILVESSSSEYKTASGERRSVLLPLVALGTGLSGTGWALSWMRARRQCGLETSSCMMPADSESQDSWLDRRMTTAEGSYWLKDLLTMTGMTEGEASQYSTHSLKATILSWAAKSSTFGWQERLVLGHHLDEETKMAVVYSRDAIAAVMVKVLRMLETIRQGIFDPDASRAERIAMATGLTHLPEMLPEQNDMERELERRLACDQEHSQVIESDVEEENIVEKPIKIPGESDMIARSCFPPIEMDQCVVHKLSGIVHGKETTDSLFCGRVLSTNMRPVDFPWDEREAHEFCEQCNRALHRV